MLWALTRYPETEDELHDLVSFLLDHITKERFQARVTCLATKHAGGALSPFEIPDKIKQVPGIAFIFLDVPDDMIFLLAANLHADVCIHRLDYPMGPGQAFAVWTRREGMSAVTVDAEGVWDLAGTVAKHLLPKSLSDVSVLH